MLNAKLVVVGGNTQYDQIDLKLPVVIGRGMDVDLTMTDELISRRHAEIFEEKGRLLVRDLGSRNGTFVNNRKIESVSFLDPEQLLTLGTMTFRAIYVVSDQTDLAQLSETVRINFNETESVLRPSQTEDQNRVSVRSDRQNQDDLETLDLDDYLKKQRSSEPPSNVSARKTTYAGPGPEPQVPSRVDTLSAPGIEPDEISAEHLNRRYPK